MTKKFRIIIAGIGGVGGYFGGKLAKAFTGSESVEIVFYARGKNMESIRANGLTVRSAEGTFVAQPALVTGNATEAGVADLIICCVKSYHLEDVMTQLKSCITANTAVLPLLNGVDAPERLQQLLPGTEIWTGCVYIVSRLTAPGITEQKGTVNALHFGAEHGTNEKQKQVLALFKQAELNAFLHENIETVVWQKFVFISAIASLTSYLNTGIGNILSDPAHKELLLSLLNEITAVAKAKQIPLPTNIIESTLEKMATLPPETTSSMQLDFSSGHQTEAETLTMYVIRHAKTLNIATPAYDMVAGKLMAHR